MKIRRKILIAESDRSIGRLIGDILIHNEYEVLFAYSGSETVRAVADRAPDAVLMDSVLPDTGCAAVLGELERLNRTAVIVMSMNPDEKERAEILEAGAMEYLAVPFKTADMLESIRKAVSLREDHDRSGGCFEVGGLVIDCAAARVTLNGNDIKLTKSEFRTIALLSRYAGKVLPYEHMIRSLWDSDDAEYGRTLRVIISKLRSKIEEDPSHPRYILNQKGVGYRLADK